MALVKNIFFTVFYTVIVALTQNRIFSDTYISCRGKYRRFVQLF